MGPWRASAIACSFLFHGSCGGKAVVDGERVGPQCAAAACDIPGVPATVDACTECVNEAICECGDLNPPSNWDLPADCDFGDGECNGRLPSNHACQVAAVGLVKCMLTDADCASLYFAAHPDSTRPLGMAFGLYRCAVCSACAAECEATPHFGVVCTLA